MAVGKNREELYELFKTGAKPSGADFKDLIDAAVNSSDDGIEKPLGDDTPLKINAHGDTENLLDFYAGDTATWRINQKPTPDLPGLNFETATGNSSRLFIDSGTGKVGLSTTTPTAKLHIQQNSSEDALRIEDQDADTTPLIVDAQGNVGIGNANPSQKLDVSGSAAIAGSLAIVNTNQNANGNTLTLGPANQTNLRLGYHQNYAWLQSHNGKPLVINPLGNAVGIGKDDPQVPLDVNGATAIAGPLTVTGKTQIGDNVGIGIAATSSHKLTVFDGDLALRVSNNTNTQSLLFQNSGGAYTWRIYREDIGGNKADLKIAGGADNDTTKLTDYLRIQNNGNTTLSGNLSVSGTGTSSFTGSVKITGKLSVPGAQQIVFENGDTSNNLKLQLWDGYGLGINSDTLFYAANGNHSWRDADGANERMKLTTTAGGSLAVKGTGTSSFAGSLTVAGTLKSQILSVDSHSRTSHVNSDGTMYRKGGQFYITVDDNFYIRDSTSSTSSDNIKFHFNTNNGSLGLKNDGNTATISVNKHRIIFALAKSYQNKKSSVSWDGDSNWDWSSDIRLKQDIEVEQNILERLMQLNVKNYRWRDEPRSSKKIGMMAQDVQPLFPALVGQMPTEDSEEESTLTLKYGAFGVLAIGGLKELKLEKDSEIAQLEMQIEDLKSQLEAMRDR